MTIRELWNRWRASFRRAGIADDLEEEMRLHAELRARRLEDEGQTPDKARTAALRQLGNLTGWKESAMEAAGFVALDRLWRDLVFASRILRKRRAFSWIAILTLALGIGANTAVYGVVDAVLLRPLPYPNPEKLGSLVSFYRSKGKAGIFADQDGRTWEMVRDRASQMDSAVLTDMASKVNVSDGAHASYALQQRVSAGFFRVLGVAPLLGREFTAAEDRAGGPPVAIVSHTLWEQLLHKNPSLVNRTILLRGERYTVVGVMPRGFKTPVLADVWTPLRPSTTGEGGDANYQIITRLKTGVPWMRAVARL